MVQLLEYTIIPIYHSILEIFYLLKTNAGPFIKFITVITLLISIFTSLGYYQLTLWSLRWIGLGIMSSIGFGFGMHTFVLFLAPHIAAVTLAAQTCKSLNFPQPPYPKEIICPRNVAFNSDVSFAQIFQKVALESFMWGLGTAIGELPPYLAARLRASSRETGGDDPDSHSIAGWELQVIKLIKKVGFFGILLCAAVPNPLFDAAGVASGIAQIPILSFFGATFIGKAIIKVSLQTLFVIFLFYHSNLDSLVGKIEGRLTGIIPGLKGLDIQGSLAIFLDEQRQNVLRKQTNDTKQTSVISYLFNWLIFIAMFLFLVSVINSLDKQYRERRAKGDRKIQ